jgi:hypothetical protein
MVFFVSTLLLLMSGTVNAETINTPHVKQRCATIAGEVKVVQLNELPLGQRFAITLNNDVVLETNSEDETS